MRKRRVVIVGAGPGGLAASMLLSSRGYNVTIFEKKDYIGGRNSPIKLGEFTFDMGPTFFLMINVLEDIFSLTGRDLHKYVEIKELDPMYRLVFSGGRSLYPSRDKQKMKDTLEAFSPGSYNGYIKYLEKEEKKYNKLIPCLKMPYGKVTDFFSRQLITSIPYLDAHTSIFNVLGRYFDNDDARIAFTFQAKYIGMSPWQAPGTFSIISYIEHGGGIFHVMGGLNRLSMAMRKAAEEDGAVVHVNTPVKRIIIENGKAVGVKLEDGTVEKADYVVINTDFAHAMTHIVEPSDIRKWTANRLENKKYSCSTFMLYLGVNKRYDDIQHHNIIFSNNYRKNVDEITRSKILSEDPSFYIQNASVTDPFLAPNGKSTIYVLVPVPNNKSKIDWNSQKSPYRDKILELMETRGGLTGIRQNIVQEKVITPLDWEHEIDVYKGATFNLAHNVGQMLYFRPHNKFEEFDNCYLVGGGTHPGSGLPTIYMSGRISAEQIMQRDDVK
ncbi:Phytoene desaturase [uncultured Desulfobacterium sp.]|uniref:Phytoene desaturase n=1 Tax=uncultured Desulfobacterium sp. TaxID=201089 RepID=A0A445MV49_9BACT|nr:Phytoene desaturase [uncultured Desulfobacterium sp.]